MRSSARSRARFFHWGCGKMRGKTGCISSVSANHACFSGLHTSCNACFPRGNNPLAVASHGYVFPPVLVRHLPRKKRDPLRLCPANPQPPGFEALGLENQSHFEGGWHCCRRCATSDLEAERWRFISRRSSRFKRRKSSLKARSAFASAFR